MFEQLFNSPFLYSLSLTLVHFLWQGLLVALILKSALFIIDKNKSKLRYGLATFAMLANAALAILTFVMVYPDTASGFNSNLSPIPLTSLVNELTQQNALLNYQELLPSILAYSLPYLSILWLMTITLLASKLLIEVRNVNNLPLHASTPPSSALLARFDALAKQIKLAKTPTLLISLKAEVPMAIGWLKPVVLLPASMVTGLDSAQLEMLILHELAHIRRHDYLVNFLQTLIELLFFFHPSVHWVGKQMRNEREYCSDDIAVHHCGDAIAYAHTLTDTASLCAKGHFHTIPTMAMAASGGDLKARVLRLVDHHCAPSNNTSKWLAAMSLLLALTLLSINQLLTMPFAKQLNNQFPWQENNPLNKSIFQTAVTPINSDKVNVGKESSSLANDSIAQQLLSRDDTLSKITSFEIADIRHETESSIQDDSIDSISPSKTPEPSVLKTSHISTESVTNIAPSPREINVDNEIKTAQITQITTPSKQEKSSEQALIQFKAKKVDIKAIEKDLANATPELQVAKQETVLPTSIMSQSTQAALTKQLATVNVPHADKNTYPKVVKKQLSEQLINDLAYKATSYNKLSYSQEINKLSSQDNLYSASHPFLSEEDKRVTKEQLTIPSPETLKPVVQHDAKLLNSISPLYPSLAKRRGIEMEVQVNFTIDRNGKVKNIHFGQQSKLIYFKSAIRTAIRKWRFSPATKGNRKIESKMSKIFSFSLQA